MMACKDLYSLSSMLLPSVARLERALTVQHQHARGPAVSSSKHAPPNRYMSAPSYPLVLHKRLALLHRRLRED